MALVLDTKQNDTSTALDLLRSLASLAVVFGHGISFFGVAKRLQPPHLPHIQNVAVILFFALSGFLIGRVLDRSTEDIGGFLIDRFSRIYSAFIPCMIFIAALAWGLNTLRPLDPTPSIAEWVQNLLMLNAYSGTACPSLCVANFVTAGHLWSVAVEFHIYLGVGFLFFALKQASPILFAGAALTAWVPLIFLGFDGQLNPGNELFYMWMFGFGAYYIVSRIEISVIVAVMLCVFSITALERTITPGREYSLAVYVWVGTGFIGLIALTQKTHISTSMTALQHFIAHVAGFSFTLYLVHHPIQFAIETLWPDSGWKGAAIAILSPIPVAIIFASIGENHHRRLSTAIRQVFRKDRQAPQIKEKAQQ